MPTVQTCLAQLNKAEQQAYKNIVSLEVDDNFVDKVINSSDDDVALQLLMELQQKLHNEAYLEELFELAGMVSALDFKDFCTYQAKAVQVQATSAEYRNKMLQEKLRGKIMERLSGGADLLKLIQSGPTR